MTEKTIHEGRNVKRIRELMGIKQDTLALELGLSQQAVSALEQKEKIDENMRKMHFFLNFLSFYPCF